MLTPPKPAPAPKLKAHPMMHPTATASVANTAFNTIRFIGRTPTILNFQIFSLGKFLKNGTSEMELNDFKMNSSREYKIIHLLLKNFYNS